MSYKTEVLTLNEVNWAASAVRLPTRQEAEAYGQELASRWLAVVDTRAVESEDPANYRFDFAAWRLVPLEGPEPKVVHLSR